jgi:recombination protein RecA
MQKDMDETMRMGVTPNLLNEFFRKYQMNNNRLVRENKQPFTLICLNQLREKIGAYGDHEYSPGGRGKGFTATVELRLKKGDWIVEGKGDDREIVGQVVKFKVEKNKTGIRMRDGEFDFYFGENAVNIEAGYNDVFKEIIICAVEWDVIERGGSWFTYGGKKYQGQESLVSALRSDSALVDKLKNQILYLSNKKG